MTQRTIVILSFALFACTLLWGGYSLLVYLGMPIHQLVYWLPDEVTKLNAACGGAETTGVFLCKGSTVFFPFLWAVLQMASPFYLYAILSALLFGGFLLYGAYKTGYFEFRFRASPLLLLSLFIASVWLLGVTLAVGSLYNLRTPKEAWITNVDKSQTLQPFNRFFEPLPQIYDAAGPEALQELKANFEDLKSRGCLQDTETQTQNGARVYTLQFWCAHGSLISRVGTQIVLVFLFLLNLLVLGSFLLRTVLRLREERPLLLFALSFGAGALGWVAILWALSHFALLRPTLIRVLFVGMPILLFQETWWWAKESCVRRFDVELSFKNVQIFLVWMLITYLALNFLNVVRPFPIGWDDLGSYLNRPKLLASYGAFIPSMSQFQWEFLSSLGYLLFGYDSWVGSTFAMQINWAAGLLSVLSVYVVARLLLGPGRGILAAILYYLLPMVGHFSFADMKIDNASFFTTALAVLAVLAYFLPAEEEHHHEKAHLSKRDYRLFVVAGLLIGFSFAIKPTAILGLIMIASMLTGVFLGPLGFTGISFFGFSVLQKFGPLDVVAIAKKLGVSTTPSPNVFLAITTILGAVFLGAALIRRREAVPPFLKFLGLYTVGIAVACLPWMLVNLSISDTFNLGTALKAQDKTAPQVFYNQKEEVDAMRLPPEQPVRYLPPELALDPDHTACKSSARTEELDRYWGFGTGINHYLGLPWRQVMNSDSFGYYVTLMPVLLLFPLLLLLPYFWSREARWLRLLTAGTFVFLLEWAFVANGIAWYGIGMFLGFVVGLEALVAYAPDKANKGLLSFFIAISIVVCLANRFWQFDTQKNLFEYPLGKITATALREVTIPDYDNIREIMLKRHKNLPDTPYTYRIGTFISYFVPQNREIFPLADHQLNFFSCLNQEQDHALTLKRLLALGFNSLVFDTNTHTIERDPNGTLHQKVAKFLEFGNDTKLGIEVEVNDPGNGIAFLVLPVGSGSVMR